MEEATVVNKGEEHDDHSHDHDHNSLIDLPPGFRFHPTDEEIITHYLTEKVMNSNFSASAIGEVDLNKCEPWDLPKKAKMGEKEWYFFCQRDRKYPTGMRTNRATEAGYWKATGKDKEIYNKGKTTTSSNTNTSSSLVGMKKTLVFYRGRAPKGEKTNWVMHEYRLEGKFSYYNLPKSAKDEWVVCRVFHKNTGMKRTPMIPDLLRMNSFGDDFLDFNNSSSLPPLMDPPSTIGNSSFTTHENNNNNNYLYNHPQHQNTTFLQQQQQQQPINNNTSYQFTSNYNQQFPIQNPLYSYQVNHSGNHYLHQGNIIRSSVGGDGGAISGDHHQAILRALAANNEVTTTTTTDSHPQQQQCIKMEQFSSNQSMISRSQDTGLSTDVNTTEISSKHVLGGNNNNNKNNKSCYDQDLEGPSVGSIVDFDTFWGDY